MERERGVVEEKKGSSGREEKIVKDMTGRAVEQIKGGGEEKKEGVAEEKKGSSGREKGE